MPMTDTMNFPVHARNIPASPSTPPASAPAARPALAPRPSATDADADTDTETDTGWYRWLANARELRALFPRGGIPLTGLALLSVTYEPGNVLVVRLARRGVPAQAPAAWRQRGALRTTLEFRLPVDSVVLGAFAWFDEMPRMRVALAEGQFFLSAEGTDKFCVAAEVGRMTLEVRGEWE